VTVAVAVVVAAGLAFGCALGLGCVLGLAHTAGCRAGAGVESSWATTSVALVPVVSTASSLPPLNPAEATCAMTSIGSRIPTAIGSRRRTCMRLAAADRGAGYQRLRASQNARLELLGTYGRGSPSGGACVEASSFILV
jgi:hypothetical protein